MNILDKIIADKKVEVALKKGLIPIKNFEMSPLFERPTNSMATKIRQSASGIIAEHKRRSPSKVLRAASLRISASASTRGDVYFGKRQLF